MTDIRQIKFDTEELLNNVNIIIQNGLNNLLKDFVEKHKIYEETHQGVLNLPSVKKLTAFARQEVNVIPDYDSDSNSDSENNDESPTMFVSIKEMAEGLVDDKIKMFEQTMFNSFQVFTSTNTIMVRKMLSQIESLNNELKELKQIIESNIKPVIDLTHDVEELQVQKEIKQIVDEVVIKEETQEKENIVLKIDEELEPDEQEESDAEEQDAGESDAEEQDAEESDAEESDAEEQDAEESDAEESDAEESDAEESDAEESDAEESDAEEQNVEEQEEVEEESDAEEQEEVEEKETHDKNQDIETEAEESLSDEEDELFEIEIEDVTYCTNDEENGVIYELSEEGEPGKKVGFLKDGEATFY
jgi:hypothetical protein